MAQPTESKADLVLPPNANREDPISGVPPIPDRPLKNLWEIARHYGRTDVDRLPVDLEAIVNYWDDRDAAIFIQDRFKALYVSAADSVFSELQRVSPGTRVRVRGRLNIEGHFIEADQIDLLESGVARQPKQVRIEQLQIGSLWSFRVIVEGRLVEVSRFGERWEGIVQSGNKRYSIQRFDSESVFDWPSLLGQRIQIEGTLIYELDASGHPWRIHIATNELDPKLKAAPNQDPNQTSRIDIRNARATSIPALRRELSALRRELSALRPEGTRAEMAYHVTGQVTFVSPFEGFLIESDGAWVFVKSELATDRLKGHQLELDLHRETDEKVISLSMSAEGYRLIPPAPPIDASTINVEHLPLRGQITGELMSVSSEGTRRQAILRVGKQRIRAEFNADAEEWNRLALDTARLVSVSGVLMPGVPGDDAVNSQQDKQILLQVPGVDWVDVQSRYWQIAPTTAIISLSFLAGTLALGTLGFGFLWLRVRRVDQRNRLLAGQLLESQKMDAIGQLASGVAHDFNNLLTGITANLDLVRRDPNLDRDETQSCVSSAFRCSQQAKRLVRSLLGFARQAELEIKTHDLNQAVEDVAMLARSSIAPEIDLQLNLNPALPQCRFDVSQLEQAILNLCFNARDAVSKNGGVIRIETDLPAEEANAGLIEIRVIDNGKGIDKDTRSRIFEPFFTTKPTGQGTGLGLSLVYGVVKQHAGQVRCSSNDDSGTTFTILIPAAGPPEPSASERDARASWRQDAAHFSTPAVTVGTESLSDVTPLAQQKYDQRAAKILLVDDDDEVRRVAGLSLEALGFAPELAASGAEALSILEEQAPFDAVVLDLQMPHMSGEETLKQIRVLSPDLPVVLCSGQVVDLENIAERSGSPPVARLEKPFQITELKNALDSVLGLREPIATSKAPSH